MDRDEYLKRMLARWIQTQRLGVTVARDVLKKLQKNNADVFKILDDPMLIREWSRARISAMNRELEETLESFGIVYRESELDNLLFLTPATMKRPPVSRALVKRAMGRPFNVGSGTTEGMVRRINSNAVNGVVSIARRATDEGLTVRQTREALSTMFKVEARHVETIARTALNSTGSQIRDEIFRSNQDIINRVVWNSALDHRTSHICMGLSGKVMPVDEGPRPPAHPNCRSVVVPLIRGESARQAVTEQLPRPAVEPAEDYKRGDNRTRTGKVRKPARGGKVQGTQTRALTYETWIKGQPVAFQRDVLGVAATERLRNGESLRSILRSRNAGLDLTQYKDVLGRW